MFQVMSKENPKLIALQEKLKKTVGKRLAEARGKDISQQGMVDELRRYGIERTQGSISHIEQGLRLPSLEMFYVLMKYLGSSADHVLGLTDDTLSPADIEEDRLANALVRLPRDKREQVITFAEYLMSQEQAKVVESSQAIRQWVAATEVLMRREGTEGEKSFVDFLISERPDLADAMRIALEKKSVQEG